MPSRGFLWASVAREETSLRARLFSNSTTQLNVLQVTACMLRPLERNLVLNLLDSVGVMP